jgi:hypothetical protein
MRGETMHFEVLVEDQSGAVTVDIILRKILGPNNQTYTYKIHPYKGIGRLPANLIGQTDPEKRILLDRLPKILRGYANSLQHIDAAVLVVVDLDRRDCLQFKQELVNLSGQCCPQLSVLFRIAIEEIEAWLLGDQVALKKAYPRAKDSFLNTYVQDSICGTWEKMADVIYQGGSTKLKKLGYPLIGEIKSEWAKNISPLIDISHNRSKSFQVFCDGVQRLAGIIT